jgi:hypothetical protein
VWKNYVNKLEKASVALFNKFCFHFLKFSTISQFVYFTLSYLKKLKEFLVLNKGLSFTK